jgi:hypothetical protein
MRRGLALTAVPVAAAALALVWWAPWSTGPDVIAHARQAFGSGREVHVLASTGIDPNGPAMRPITSGESVEVWYDASRKRSHEILRRGTKVVLDRVATVQPHELSAPADVARLYEFVVGYRSGLADGEYRADGSARVEGRLVVWLRSDALRVAVDPVSYQPIWLRPAGSTLLTQLAVAETKPYDPADFLTAKQRRPRHL